MPPLIAYGSSDEEDDDDILQPHQIESVDPPSAASSKKTHSEPIASVPPAPIAALPSHNAPPQGPALGPSMPFRPDDEPMLGTDPAPHSPYTVTRLSTRDLTMPAVPNFDIPPSPPGSPPLAATKRFTRFLELKKQGIHFNTKLETSSALKNPNLLPRLRAFAGIDEKDSLASALPEGLAVPASFPAWAYAEQLNKTQQLVKKKKEEDQAQRQRESIDFVSATMSGAPSRTVTPGVPKGVSSVSERVMAGLNRDKPSTQDIGKRKDDRNGGRSEAKRSRFDERPR